MKYYSQFSAPADSTRVSDKPCAGGILHLPDLPGLPLMLSIMMESDESPKVTSIFIRECYLTWFDRFILDIKQTRKRKFGLSSTPGCGKTMAINFILKMATSVPELRDRPILLQYRKKFFYIKSDRVFRITASEARKIAGEEETFYILDGHGAKRVLCHCLTLFISSPRDYFRSWLNQAMITSSYFPVWTLDELRKCRMLCYGTIAQTVVDDRYSQYGGIPRYVFCLPAELPSLENVIADSEARESIRAVWDPSAMFPTSHILLHISVDENFHYHHLVLASRCVGVLLFSRHFQQMFDRLKEVLGGGFALGFAGSLFECYIHYLFENGYNQPLICRSLEGLHCLISRSINRI